MGTPPGAALALLIGALPVCAWVAHADLSRLKIPNRAVGALVLVFAVLGLAFLPLADWAWRWTHLGVVLSGGVALNALGLAGAGDAKFAAAAAPFVALPDWRALLLLLLAALLVAAALHRLARATVGPRLAPGWLSWTSGKRFPMGVPLSGALLAYLLLCAAA